MPVKDIAPIVAYLCHESFEENGSVIETFGGWVTKIKVQQGKGMILKKPHSMEDGIIIEFWVKYNCGENEKKFFHFLLVRDNWNDICDMSKARYPTAASGMC